MTRKNTITTENNTIVEKPKRGRPRKVVDAVEMLAKKKTTKLNKDGKPRKAYAKKVVEPMVETPVQKVFVASESIPSIDLPIRVNTERLELPSVKHSKLVTILMWLGLVGFAVASMALANMLFPLWVEQLKMVGLFR